MISKEILSKVRHIEISTRKIVNTVFAGTYHSNFKGQGMDFAEFREYYPGDDVRLIAWKPTAKSTHPYVKQLQEERELSMILMVDMSGSEEFGTTSKMKMDIVIEVCSILAFSAIKNNDRVGLIIFTDQVELYIPPKKGKNHVLRVIRELILFKPKSQKTNIAESLRFLNSVCKKHSVVFMASDFIDDNFEKPLKIANKRNDFVAVRIRDPLEDNLPQVGLVEFYDNESGEIICVDTKNSEWQRDFLKHRRANSEKINRLFQMNAIDSIELSTSEDYVKPLIRFFKNRVKR